MCFSYELAKSGLCLPSWKFLNQWIKLLEQTECTISHWPALCFQHWTPKLGRQSLHCYSPQPSKNAPYRYQNSASLDSKRTSQTTAYNLSWSCRILKCLAACFACLSLFSVLFWCQSSCKASQSPAKALCKSKLLFFFVPFTFLCMSLWVLAEMWLVNQTFILG